mmetsp:Transcript_18933/g.18079  ORF Transcript_18933/g.18079 Transcript_18933/m.18079 type:complete len:102 (-) Transcript_18933:752-1057(-)
MEVRFDINNVFFILLLLDQSFLVYPLWVPSATFTGCMDSDVSVVGILVFFAELSLLGKDSYFVGIFLLLQHILCLPYYLVCNGLLHQVHFILPNHLHQRIC